MTRATIVAMFCSDPMSGSHFIVQTNKFLLMDATGQGQGKVIQYISPDPCILCAKYQRFSWNGFDVRGKSFCAAETDWKPKVTPDRGDLMSRQCFRLASKYPKTEVRGVWRGLQLQPFRGLNLSSGNIQIYLHFLSFLGTRGGAGSWNTSSWEASVSNKFYFLLWHQIMGVLSAL